MRQVLHDDLHVLDLHVLDQRLVLRKQIDPEPVRPNHRKQSALEIDVQPVAQAVIGTRSKLVRPVRPPLLVNLHLTVIPEDRHLVRVHSLVQEHAQLAAPQLPGVRFGRYVVRDV